MFSVKYRLPKSGCQDGLTLVEMIIVIAVSAILLSAAIPSFNAITLSSKLTSATNDLVADMRFARSEAIKRNKIIALCPSSDGSGCSTATDLRYGWILFIDNNANSSFDSGETILRTHGTPASGVSVTSTASFPLLFRPSGVSATVTTIKICRYSPAGTQERLLSVIATGKTSVSTTNTGVCP